MDALPKRILMIISTLGILAYLFKLIWSTRTATATQASRNQQVETPGNVLHCGPRRSNTEHCSSHEGPRKRRRRRVVYCCRTFAPIRDRCWCGPRRIGQGTTSQKLCSSPSSITKYGPSYMPSWQLVKYGSAIMNSENANIENTFHFHLSQSNRIEQEMINTADCLKIKYRLSSSQEKNISGNFHFLDSTEPTIPSLPSVEDIFLPVRENYNPPRRILILQTEKFIGSYLACVWGTQERGFMDNFSIVYLIKNTVCESTTVQAEILNICGSTDCALKPITIFRATKRFRHKALIIIEDLDRMDHTTKQDLLQIFQNPVDSYAKYLQLATYVVVSSSEPTDGLQFEKTVAI